MDRIRTGIALVLWWAVLACSSSPRTIKSYDKDGIRFSHYSDWSVTDDAPIEGSPNARTIDLEGPNNALVAFICLPASSRQTLETFAASVAERRAEVAEDELSGGLLGTAEVSKGTSAAIRGQVSGQERDGILQRFSISVLGKEVPHEAKFFAVSNGRYKVIIMTQVASENARDAYPAFDLTLDSFSIQDPD